MNFFLLFRVFSFCPIVFIFCFLIRVRYDDGIIPSVSLELYCFFLFYACAKFASRVLLTCFSVVHATGWGLLRALHHFCSTDKETSVNRRATNFRVSSKSTTGIENFITVIHSSNVRGVTWNTVDKKSTWRITK